MPSMIFDSCCCCIDLRSGCLILGYLQLISLVSSLGKFLLALLSETKEIEKLLEGSGVSVLGLVAIYLLIMGLFLGFNITFLVGVHKNKRGHVLAYLIFTTVVNALTAIAIFVAIVISQIYLLIIALFIFVGINGYYLMVIRSYYYKMDESNIRDRGMIYSDPPAAAVAPYTVNTVHQKL